MEDRLQQLEAECALLNQKLMQQNALKNEVEALKEELEKSLETHKTLQEVALAFEEENRCMTKKYNTQLKEKANLEVMKIEFEQEIEAKTHNYQLLEKRYNKIREKIVTFEDLKDDVYSLENDKKRNSDKIKELQDTVSAYEKGNGLRSKESEEKIKKLTKENSELSIQLESYIDEMEELDGKNESLEKENNEFKIQFERLKKIEIVGSSVEQIQNLESQITHLEEKLKKEATRRDIVENELFKIEEEYENFKIEIENNENKFELTKVESSLMEENEGEADDVIIKRQQLIISNLNAERNELQAKIQTLEQELEILLEENNDLAKLNLHHEQKKKEMFEEKQTLEEENKLNIKKLEEEISQLTEQVHNNKNVDQLDGGELENKTLEVERLKNEMKMTQDYLRVATDKHSEIQNKMQILESQSSEKIDQLKEFYETQNEEIQNDLLNDIVIKFNQERNEYDTRLLDQHAVIEHLEERILALKSFYETKPVSVEGSTPSPESTPPVAIKNGKYHDSMDELRDYNYNGFQRSTGDEELDEDTLSDRELRRIAYKIADGNWSELESELGVSAHDLSLIRRGASNDQEKVYRLLVSWRSDLNLNRSELLKRLCEHIDPKRKDIIKFLKEMAGISTNERLNVKKRFKMFTRSIKR